MHGCVAHGSDGNIEAMSIYVRNFLLHHRQSIVSSLMKEEVEARDLQLAHMLEGGRVPILYNQNTLNLET
jgi:hypothetical protein